MKKYLFLFILMSLLLFLFSNSLIAGNETFLSNFRYSLSKEKIRLVFDMSKEITYSVTRKGNPETFTIDLPEVKLNKELKENFKPDDHLLEEVFFSELDKGGVKVKITLKYPLPSDKFKFFLLENPHRLVVDFYRNFEEKSITYLTENIIWSNIIQGSSTGRIIINIVEVDLSGMIQC